MIQDPVCSIPPRTEAQPGSLLHRRSFLARLSLVGLGGTVALFCHPWQALLRAGLALAGHQPIQLDTVTSDVFAAVQGSTFRIRSASGKALEMRLIQVKSWNLGPAAPRGSKRAPFALMFRASNGNMLSQETYTIEHDRLGRFSLFLVPVGSSRKDAHYEAIFG